MAKSWKDLLLSTGLPLEHDVKQYLEGRGCIASHEYSYLRPDEQGYEKQFSYDIDAAYIRGGNFLELMVECKYRHPTVNWVFTPDIFGGPDELYPNAFLHPFDHFVAASFPFGGEFPRSLGPCCSKGVELTTDGANEKAITQALSQLAFGFAPKLASAIEHQALHLLGSNSNIIFFHVPVIVTTAKLYRLCEKVTLDTIREASTFEEVSKEEKCLLVKCRPGVGLRNYNLQALHALEARIGEGTLKSAITTFTDDVSHLFSVLADRSPSLAIVISVADGWQAFDHVFSYINEVLNPSESLVAEIQAREAVLREKWRLLEQRVGRPSKVEAPQSGQQGQGE
jgi:hypothetical protein